MIEAALLGCGYWGSNLCRVLERSPLFALRWLCDSSPAALERVSRTAPEAKRTLALDEVLLDERVSAIVVATPVAQHYEHASKALIAGKHVLVEKPLAQTSAQAERLCSEAATRGLRLMVGHTFMYNQAVRQVKAMLDAGEVGDVRYVFTQRLNLGIVRSDVNALWSLAPHDLSILDYWIDRDVVNVEAVGHSFLQPGIADVAFAHITYSDGIAGHLHVSWLDPIKVRRATIVGSRKMIVYDDVDPEHQVALYDKGIDLEAMEHNIGRYQSYADHRMTVRAGDVWLRKINGPEPLALEVEEFANAIREQREPMTSGRSGLAVVRLLERLSERIAGAHGTGN